MHGEIWWNFSTLGKLLKPNRCGHMQNFHLYQIVNTFTKKNSSKIYYRIFSNPFKLFFCLKNYFKKLPINSVGGSFQGPWWIVTIGYKEATHDFFKSITALRQVCPYYCIGGVLLEKNWPILTYIEGLFG